MMKNLLSIPSQSSGPVVLADALEMQALKGPRYRASQNDLIAGLDRKEDEDEDDLERPTQDALAEINLRIKHLGRYTSFYPFVAEETSVIFKKGRIKEKEFLYLFLLFATRLNMRDERKFAGIDGAFLFESLSSEVALNFWGGRSDKHSDALVESIVFGTSRSTFDSGLDKTPKGFKYAVDQLCEKLGEGGGYQAKTSDRTYPQDDRVDVVVWRKFSDARDGRLIAFGQCKTGTHWQKELPRLRPESFCKKWLKAYPSITPFVLFFLTDRVNGSLLNHCYDTSGILFDRCRLLDYSLPLPKTLLADCIKWTKAVMGKHGLG